MSNREYTSLRFTAPSIASEAVGPIMDVLRHLRQKVDKDDPDCWFSFAMTRGRSPSLTLTASCGDDAQWDEDVSGAIRKIVALLREGGIVEYEPGDRLHDVDFLGSTHEIRQQAKRRHFLSIRQQVQEEIARIDEAGSGALHQCGDCGKIHSVAALKKPKDLEQRMDFPPGDSRRIEPSGECPGCGALCYPVPAHENAKRVLEVVADQEGWTESTITAVLLDFIDGKSVIPGEFRDFLAQTMASSDGKDEQTSLLSP